MKIPQDPAVTDAEQPLVLHYRMLCKFDEFKITLGRAVSCSRRFRNPVFSDLTAGTTDDRFQLDIVTYNHTSLLSFLTVVVAGHSCCTLSDNFTSFKNDTVNTTTSNIKNVLSS